MSAAFDPPLVIVAEVDRGASIEFRRGVERGPDGEFELTRLQVVDLIERLADLALGWQGE